MQGKTIAVVTDNQKLWRRISGPLASAGTQMYWVRRPETASELFSSTPVDLVLVDPMSVEDAIATLAAAGARCPIVAITAGPTAPVVGAWCSSGARGLVARLGDGEVEPDFDPADVLVAAGKLLRADLFGLEKHLSTFGASIESRVVTRSSDREAVLEALDRMARRLRLGSRRGRLLSDVADELVTNAIYDAPRGRDGRARYLHVDRRSKIDLLATEYVTVRYGSDARMFGVSVTDGFGGLGPGRLASCLLRTASDGDQIEQKAGGAGIGLYLALRSADHLVISTTPGQRTEVTALWRLDRRGPGPVATLSYLVAEPSIEVSAVPTIELSESARVEVTRTLAESARVEVEIDADRAATERTTAPAPFREETTMPEIEVGWPSDPQVSLRGVQLLRPTAPPGLDTTIARLRGETSTTQLLTAATAYLMASWSAVAVLAVDEDELRPICAGGDVDQPELVEALRVARRGPGSGGALAYIASQRGMMFGPLARFSEEGALAAAMIGADPSEGLAMALTVGLDVPYVLFACRPRGHGFDDRADYQRLLRELCLALTRAERHERSVGEGGGYSAVH